MIDEFTLAELNDMGLRTIPIKEATTFQTYVAYRKGTTREVTAAVQLRRGCLVARRSERGVTG